MGCPAVDITVVLSRNMHVSFGSSRLAADLGVVETRMISDKHY